MRHALRHVGFAKEFAKRWRVCKRVCKNMELLGWQCGCWWCGWEGPQPLELSFAACLGTSMLNMHALQSLGSPELNVTALVCSFSAQSVQNLFLLLATQNPDRSIPIVRLLPPDSVLFHFKSQKRTWGKIALCSL